MKEEMIERAGSFERELTISRHNIDVVEDCRIEGGNFGAALQHLQTGGRVSRLGWNGKGMFLFLVPGSTFLVNRPPLLGIYPEGTEINYQPHIDMKTADGRVVPWVASQSDLLASDWVLHGRVEQKHNG